MKKDKKQKNDSPEKVRKFPRFGVLDAVIILLIIAIGVGLVFRYNVFQTITQFQDLKEYTVTFSVKNIEDTTPNYVRENDTVYFKDSGDSFGKITTISDVDNTILKPTPAEQSFLDNGTLIVVNYPSGTRIDVEGRLICEGSIADDGSFLLNGSNYIAPGQSYVVCTEKVTLQINILSIDAVE